MPIPYTLLTAAAACGLWWAGHAWSCHEPSQHAYARPPGMALAGSAYGSLTARVMRDTLYSYWHEGESSTPPPPKPAATTPADAPAPPPPPGRFARLGRPAPPPPAPVAAAEEPPLSWLQNRITDLTRLENRRTKRNSKFTPSAAHRRYLNESAGWRLRLAHELDPGDAILYEILHFHLTSQGLPTDIAQKKVNDLAQRAIQHGLTSRASLSDALTGAGAAINLLNDQLQTGKLILPGDAAILNNWKWLNLCLNHYRTVRKQANDEGWWEGIPEIRRQEIEAHASFLESVADTVRKKLVATQMIP